MSKAIQDMKVIYLTHYHCSPQSIFVCAFPTLHFISFIQAQTQSSWVERNQLDSGVLSDELKNLFLKEIATPGIEWEAGIELTLLKGIKMDEVRSEIETGSNRMSLWCEIYP